jgi:hypothetical protein
VQSIEEDYKDQITTLQNAVLEKEKLLSQIEERFRMQDRQNIQINQLIGS